jgi:hypothetical protein
MAMHPCECGSDFRFYNLSCRFLEFSVADGFSVSLQPEIPIELEQKQSRVLSVSKIVHSDVKSLPKPTPQSEPPIFPGTSPSDARI